MKVNGVNSQTQPTPNWLQRSSQSHPITNLLMGSQLPMIGVQLNSLSKSLHCKPEKTPKRFSYIFYKT